jgi:hypothetical protein
MPISTTRTLILGLLAAAMLLGLTMAPSASASAGPFWYHRANEKGEGTKIEPAAPENLSGEGSRLSFEFELAGIPILIDASLGVQVKAAIFNGANQGQIKTELVFRQPVLGKPEVKGCNVVIGNSNIVVVKGHLAWKWNGEKSQLEEEIPSKGQTPDLIFTPTELPVQKPEPALLNLSGAGSGGFTTITLSGSGCGATAGTYTVNGSQVGIPNLILNEFSKGLAVRTVGSEGVSVEGKKIPGTFFQHFWNGTAYLGAVFGISTSGNPSALETQIGLTASQEIAIKEK